MFRTGAKGQAGGINGSRESKQSVVMDAERIESLPGEEGKFDDDARELHASAERRLQDTVPQALFPVCESLILH